MKTGITVIVSEHRAEHGKVPTFTRRAPALAPATVKPAFVPFPPGTVRGPYFTGVRKERVQFLVQTSGGWVPFMDSSKNESACEDRAKKFAATV
jgi:hypothetical protein